jgi:hypothetical protein
MTILTKSEFIYGFEVDATNRNLPIDEGGGELNALLNIGTYSFESFLTEVERALNEVSGQVYTITKDRQTRFVTITADTSNFELLFSSASTATVSCRELLGFDAVDTISDISHTGTNAAGKSYKPQFKLQDFVDFQDNVESSQAAVNTSASGVTEVVKFGLLEKMECNITYATDRDLRSCGVSSNIEYNATGVSNLRDFMSYCIGKGDLEFIPDRDDADTFTTCFLESTPESKEGVNFKLKELYAQKLIGFFETGKLIFRKVVR